MTLKSKIIASVVALAVSFAFGRYSNRQANVSKDTQTDTHIVKEEDKKKKIVIVKDPDGKETTVITEEDTTKTTTDKSKDTRSVVSSRGSIVSVNAMAGVDFSRDRKPMYGVSVSKEFIGPVTLGAWAMSGGVVGLSVGVNF